MAHRINFFLILYECGHFVAVISVYSREPDNVGGLGFTVDFNGKSFIADNGRFVRRNCYAFLFDRKSFRFGNRLSDNVTEVIFHAVDVNLGIELIFSGKNLISENFFFIQNISCFPDRR